MPNYLRLLAQAPRLSLRYYHYPTCGRALMGDTAVQEPPKHVYLYHYLPYKTPELFGKMNSYVLKKDQFELEHLFANETFEFRYSGEQWDIGSLSMNLLWFLGPLLLFLLVSYEDYANSKKRGIRADVYSNAGGLYIGQYASMDEKPFDKD